MRIPLTLLTGAWLLLVGPAAAQAEAPTPGWFEGGYNAALREARASDQPVLLACLPEWSDFSRRMLDEVLVDPEVLAALGGRVRLLVDPDDGRGAQIVRLHAVTDFPCLVFLTPAGRIEDRIVGFIPAAALVQQLRRIDVGSGTVSGLAALCDAAPDDLDLRYALADQYAWVGSTARASELFASILADDPEGRTRAAARLILQAELDAQRAEAGGELPPGAVDLERLGRCVAGLASGPGRVQGWDQLANLALAAGDPARAVAAWRAARDSHGSDDDLAGWCLATSQTLVQARQQLDREALEFARELAIRCLELRRAAAPAEPRPGSPEARALAAALDAMAWAHFAVGDVQAALPLVDEALALAPDNPEYANRAAFFLAGG